MHKIDSVSKNKTNDLYELLVTVEAAENLEDIWGLIWYLQCWIYTSNIAWIHLQNSVAAVKITQSKDIFPWNIS